MIYSNISLTVNLWKNSLLQKMKQDHTGNHELVEKVDQAAPGQVHLEGIVGQLFSITY